MEWGRLFFSPEGRVGQKEFWIGFLILFVGGWLIHIIPLAGTAIWLLSHWCWFCLYGKRLHDTGRSALWQILPFVLGHGLILLGLMTGVIGGIVALFSNNEHYDLGMLFGSLGASFGMILTGMMTHLIFLLWVGLSPGTPGENRYGPTPGVSL